MLVAKLASLKEYGRPNEVTLVIVSLSGKVFPKCVSTLVPVIACISLALELWSMFCFVVVSNVINSAILPRLRKWHGC